MRLVFIDLLFDRYKDGVDYGCRGTAVRILFGSLREYQGAWHILAAYLARSFGNSLPTCMILIDIMNDCCDVLNG